MESICLVEPSAVSGTLRVNRAALSFLKALDGPLQVVSIFGPKGTGKSFLMDQLAEQGEDFPRSPGIWLCCSPHPTKPDKTLVWLDTEGLPEQMEEDETSVSFKLFLLEVLLCNIFIYNTRGAWDLQKELDKLIYVKMLPDKVQVLEHCPQENSFLLSSMLPDFVWCLRDVVSDSFWEEVLQAMDYNLDALLPSPAALENTPTNYIQALFPSQKAFCFCSPHVDGKDREAVSSDFLNPIFQAQLWSLKDYILYHRPKNSLGSKFCSGKDWCAALERFVDVLSLDGPILLNKSCDGQEATFSWHENYERFNGPVIDPPWAAPKTPQLLAEEPWQENYEDFNEPEIDPPWKCKEIPSVPQLPVQEPRIPPPSSSWAVPLVDPNNMEEPMCLIENNPGEKLQVNQEALQLLERINQPVVVVAIVGLYRTGKSYLMNKLAGKDKGGFSLGATVQANTKGIWMWCRPHPRKPDHTLVLLDTEGLGDVEKSNIENDSWVFALSILLSSTFVYNSMGTIDQFALEKLHYVTELTERIKVKASGRRSCEEDDEIPDDFIWFFPTFIWAVRDFTLQLELDGHPITGDEYLENALRRREGGPENLDLAKKYIREYFPRRKCFVFDRPATRQELVQLEDLPERKLNPDFIGEAHRFRSYIFETAEAKVIPGGHTVTGTLLGHLAVTYVDAIRSGAIPCIENAVLALAQIENSAAVYDGIKRYEELMQLMLELPTETVEELLAVHVECEKEAIQVFLDRAFKDEGQGHQEQLKNQIQTKLEELCSLNEQESLDRCHAILLELFQDLEEKICNGSYAVPGGYQCFLKDQRKKVEAYNQAPCKGLMATMALQDFLKSKETAAQSILQADRNLTDRQRELEVEKVRAAAAEREAELQRQMKEQTQRMAEQNERSYRAHEAQLRTKMEEDHRRQLIEYERVLNHKLQEQRHLLQQQNHQEAARLQSEIANLNHRINNSGKKKKGCIIC
ncbi:guanylate-binding protein 2-like [Heteronotia binoei]|uniref:guanylate-binding protein 2-like n=1 Tax=Heteronotia binoei TaxID=13085 RepID=UPI002930A6B4|nr:guanylate-binding protein 2-like [Heteronotia binoei]